MSRKIILERLEEYTYGASIELSLGSNYELLLNFWGYYDSLSVSRKREVARRREANRNRHSYFESLSQIRPFFGEIIDQVTSGLDPTLRTTSFEIYLIDQILNRGIEPFYIKLYENL